MIDRRVGEMDMNVIQNQWFNHNEPFEFEIDNETAEVKIDLQLYMQEKLTRAIEKEMNSKISSKSRTMKDVTCIVKK
jgi:hypothetical protein